MTRDEQLIKAALDMAAATIDKRRDEYIRDCGSYDSTTGVTEFPGNGDETVEEWETCAEAIRAITPADVLAKVGNADDDWTLIASDVAEQIAEGGGFWRSCSGCHESNEGVTNNPYSHTFQCHLGGGCRECGGIGAIWDSTDYSGFLDGPETLTVTPQPDAHAVARLVEAAEFFDRRRKSIENDVSSGHSGRGPGASSWMREDDSDFRLDLRNAFDALSSALAAFKEVRDE